MSRVSRAGLGGDDVQIGALLGGVGHAPLGEQFGKHADGRERRLQFVRDVADEIGFLPRQFQFGVQAADDEPASDADGQHQHGDEQAERQFGGVRRLGELRGIDEIRGHLPMRQRLADFRGDERAFPVRLRNRRAKARPAWRCRRAARGRFHFAFPGRPAPDRANRPRRGPDSVARRKSNPGSVLSRCQNMSWSLFWRNRASMPSVPLPMSWRNSASAGITLDRLCCGSSAATICVLSASLINAALRADLAGLRRLVIKSTLTLRFGTHGIDVHQRSSGAGLSVLKRGNPGFRQRRHGSSDRRWPAWLILLNL